MNDKIAAADRARRFKNMFSAAEADDDLARSREPKFNSVRHMVAADAMRKLGADDTLIERVFGYLPRELVADRDPRPEGFDI